MALTDDKLVLPSNLILGLAVAVIVAPSNKDERANENDKLILWGIQIPVNKLWGRRNELMWLMGILKNNIQVFK